jgi:hypothetical protein
MSRSARQDPPTGVSNARQRRAKLFRMANGRAQYRTRGNQDSHLPGDLGDISIAQLELKAAKDTQRDNDIGESATAEQRITGSTAARHLPLSPLQCSPMQQRPLFDMFPPPDPVRSVKLMGVLHSVNSRLRSRNVAADGNRHRARWPANVEFSFSSLHEAPS